MNKLVHLSILCPSGARIPPARSAGNLLMVLLGRIQRKSYTKYGAKRREILGPFLVKYKGNPIQNPARSAGNCFEFPFAQNAKEILYKIRREAAENFVAALLGKIQRESYTKSGAKRRGILVRVF